VLAKLDNFVFIVNQNNKSKLLTSKICIMKLKLLIILCLQSFAIIAQDTIRTLVITEARLNHTKDNFIEMTNMGDKDVQLNQFKVGTKPPWGGPPYTTDPGRKIRLPDRLLKPGESFVIANAYDFEAKQFAKGLEGYDERPTNTEMYEIADIMLHQPEINGDKTDSISPNYLTLDAYHGRDCYFLEQHLSETDSVVVDQVNGVFDGPNGLNISWTNTGGYDVAGYPKASRTAILVRKFSVKNGNLDFANARGVGLDDSEWIPIPIEGGRWRSLKWTLGNHEDAKLNEKTLESSQIKVDFVNKTLKIPWGIRRADDIMNYFVKKHGIAWNYHCSSNTQDSLSHAAKTGDKLEIFVCGNNLERAIFEIMVENPTPDANIVVPVSNKDPEGDWIKYLAEGILDWPRISQNNQEMDTIWGQFGGIPFATSIDSLLERLEFPSNSRHEFIWVDGIQRPDLKHGDKLKVIAENGNAKDYFIKVLNYRESNNANLSAITWPDIPDTYKGVFGWIGDTIPGFNSTIQNYRIQVPLDVDGIPALIAKPFDLNAKISVERAKNLTGTIDDRTITFTVTSEDNSSTKTYKVELVKEKNPVNIQPYFAEPFISEFVFKENFANNFVEICNPGNQPLDFSNYMIAMGQNTSPTDMIKAGSLPNYNWLNRYEKYVPGYKWVSEIDWSVNPATLKQDLNTNSIVMPGDVFCLGDIFDDNRTQQPWAPDYKWPTPDNLDIIFYIYTGKYGRAYSNPWNEPVARNATAASNFANANLYLFKILNDSVKLGLKSATDPNDFKLIDVFGMGGERWIVGGVPVSQVWNYIRKPEIYKGNPVYKSSFGTTPQNCEWKWTNQAYWQAQNVVWPFYLLNVSSDIGQHFMNTPTHFMSTVSSVVYKVSEGASKKEQIRGLVTGTTQKVFLENIIKANENQTLIINRSANGTVVESDGVIQMNDTLTVFSADKSNVTKYILNVTDEGLSSDAVLKSNRYIVTIEQQPKSASAAEAGVGNIKGFEYGTSLRTILANITVPYGASLTVIDGKGAYVPLKMLNFDTTYVNVTVNDDIYLNVVAENGITTINYQLVPSSSDNEAFLLSNVYDVVQRDFLIQYVPRGTNVSTFISHLVPSGKATMKLVNKMGQERLEGEVADDDKVIVTSVNGEVNNIYYIAKLATRNTPEVTYLAYILSRVYAIDQVEYKISGVSGSESVSAFLSRISASPGANAYVVNKNGEVKTTGDIDGSDLIKVISADGKINVFYTFGPLTSANSMLSNNIQLYPNPTDGEINISGLKAGYSIKVYNSLGAAIREINVQGTIEKVSLSNEPAGMYLFVVIDNRKILGRYKAMKY
jgi:hypothetical protein